jgi:hypothetical protein
MAAARQREVSNKALKWAACIRAHGVPSFPDPTVNAGGMQFQGPPGSAPQFHAAQQACQKLTPLSGQ